MVLNQYITSLPVINILPSLSKTCFNSKYPAATNAIGATIKIAGHLNDLITFGNFNRNSIAIDTIVI